MPQPSSDQQRSFHSWRASCLLCLAALLCAAALGIVPTRAAGGTAGANATERLTLSQSVKQGLEVHPRIKAAQAEVRKAQANIGEKRSGFLPSLTAEAGSQDITSLHASGPTDQDYIDQRIDTVSLRLTQTLFSGLTVLNSYQKAKLRVEVMRARRDREEVTLIRDIQTEFLKLLKAKEDIASHRDSIERLKVNLEKARSFHRRQVVPYVRVLQAEVDLADAEQKLSRAKNELYVQRERLRTLLQLDSGRDPEYKGDLENFTYEYDRSLQECLEYAYANRPELASARKSLQMAREELAVQKGKFSPQVQVSGSLIHRNTDFEAKRQTRLGSLDRDQKNNYASVQIQLSWDLFQGGRRYYQHEKAQEEIRRLRYQMQSTRTRIRTEVRSNYSMLREAKSRIRSTKAAVRAAREGYNRAKKRYESEIGTLPELLDAQARLSRAEANQNQALVDYQLAMARLYYAMGKQNPDLRPRALSADSSG